MGQEETVIAVLVTGLCVVTFLVLTYNTLARLRQHVRESWSGVDTELRRRYDLIPNLVETVRGYAQHEQEILRRIAEARTRAVASVGPPSEQARDENALVAALGQLLAVVEAYPQIKADRHFLELQKQLETTEDRIQAARRLYNANVRDLNTRLEVFPSNLVGKLFGFTPEPFFEIESVVRTVPIVGADRPVPSSPQAPTPPPP